MIASTGKRIGLEQAAPIARTGWFPLRGSCKVEREVHEMRGNSTFMLAQGQLVTFRLKTLPLRIACLTGQLWATADRDPADHLIGPNQSVSFSRRKTVVVQALRPSTMHVQLPEPETVADYPPGSKTISNTPVVVP